jgi:hypothetical protein
MASPPTPSGPVKSCRARSTARLRRCCVRPAALLPYPAHAERRPVALRPTLSSGLPLSGLSLFLLTTAKADIKKCAGLGRTPDGLRNTLIWQELTAMRRIKGGC